MNFQQFYALEKEKPYFKKLIAEINKRSLTSTIYPPSDQVFNAFKYCDLDQVRVVILGQDPYHQAGQAHGLSFSVNKGVKLPPSLRNIFKELEEDLKIKNVSGDLTPWAKQGVLLLNTTLTVEDSKPMSHQKLGWEEFTSNIIKLVSEQNEKVIFVLWGNHAKQHLNLIDTHKHLVLMSAHPSPLSASRGFFGSRVFSKINEHLEYPIDWRTF